MAFQSYTPKQANFSSKYGYSAYVPPKGSVLPASTVKTPTPKTTTKTTTTNGIPKLTAPKKTDNQDGSGEEDLKKQQQQELDDLYGNIFNQIGAMKANLQASKPQLLSVAAAPYEAVVPKVNQALQEGQQTYETAKTDASRQGENALTAARNLYNELSARNRQLFGGVTNVGQAASELLGRQQMQSMGDTRQNTSNQLQQYTLKAQQLKEKADAQLQQLEMQKQAAIQEAELMFRDKLSELDNLEVQTKTNKSRDKMNLLQGYLQRVYQINDEARAEERALRLQAANVNLSGYGDTAEGWTTDAGSDYENGALALNNEYGQSQQDMQAGMDMSSQQESMNPYAYATPVKKNKLEDYAFDPFSQASQMAGMV